MIGDFKITDVSPEGIIMKNRYPLEINDGAIILDGNIRFRVINDIAIPYASSGENRGMSQTILPGTLISINGLNYPGFYYDFENKMPIEELILNFSTNNIVNTDEASYKTTSIGDKLYLLGNSYWLPNPNRASIISGFSTIRKTFPKNGSLSLEEGYALTLKEAPENRTEVIIKREGAKSQFNVINGTNFTQFFKDVYYETFVNSASGRSKSNVVQEGDEFEYWVEYDEDRKYKLFSGTLETMNENNVTMEVKYYQKPREILVGMMFGEFEVKSISEGTYILKNVKPLKFEPGNETAILGGAIWIKKSANEPVFYPFISK